MNGDMSEAGSRFYIPEMPGLLSSLGKAFSFSFDLYGGVCGGVRSQRVLNS